MFDITSEKASELIPAQLLLPIWGDDEKYSLYDQEADCFFLTHSILKNGMDDTSVQWGGGEVASKFMQMRLAFPVIADDGSVKVKLEVMYYAGSSHTSVNGVSYHFGVQFGSGAGRDQIRQLGAVMPLAQVLGLFEDEATRRDVEAWVLGNAVPGGARANLALAPTEDFVMAIQLKEVTREISRDGQTRTVQQVYLDSYDIIAGDLRMGPTYGAVQKHIASKHPLAQKRRQVVKPVVVATPPVPAAEAEIDDLEDMI